MPFCKECGHEIEEGANFCPNCGTSVMSKKETDNGEFSQANESTNFQTMKRNETTPYGSYRLEALPEGFVIDERYEIKQKLGQGGFGAVYLAYDKHLEIHKALKIIPESVAYDREAMSELKSEARTMVTMNNEHIVRVYDIHHTGSIKYIDMEYVSGKPLNELKLDYTDRKIPEGKVIELGVQIAEGLSHAHNNRVIHKDIKPQNIMVADNGLIKIMDFGISEALRTSISRIANTSASTGTLVYMSPEQLKGENIGIESDIYSFGAMIYELLSGNPPFYRGAIEYQVLNEIPKDIDYISEELNFIIQKCLEKDYKKRFNDFNTLLSFLEKRNSNQRRHP